MTNKKTTILQKDEKKKGHLLNQKLKNGHLLQLL